MSNRAPSARTGKQQNHTDSVAALRFLAAVCGRSDVLLNDEEAYGIEVLLKLIADKVEGGAA